MWSSRRFKPWEGPNRSLLCDCEIFVKLRLKLYLMGSGLIRPEESQIAAAAAWVSHPRTQGRCSTGIPRTTHGCCSAGSSGEVWCGRHVARGHSCILRSPRSSDVMAVAGSVLLPGHHVHSMTADIMSWQQDDILSGFLCHLCFRSHCFTFFHIWFWTIIFTDFCSFVWRKYLDGTYLISKIWKIFYR